MAQAAACVMLYMDNFFSFHNKYTKRKCKQGSRLIPTVLLHEHCEVALVFYALGGVNRTNGLCFGHIFIAALLLD